MDLIDLSVELINDVQQLRRDYRSGKISLETYSNELDGICQIEKLANVMLKTKITEERFKSTIVGAKKLISIGDLETEIVECPANGEQIERSQCLDFSGEKKFKECEKCKIGAETKNLLLPEK